MTVFSFINMHFLTLNKGEGDVEGEGEGEGEVEGECEGDSEIECEGDGKGNVAQLLYKKISCWMF